MEGNGKTIAVVGLNGSGKTGLMEAMRRGLASDSVRYMAFCDCYGGATDRAYYLQLRWNQHDIDAETPTVGARLERAFRLTGPDTAERRGFQRELYELFGMDGLLDAYVILLSSGELRRFQIVRTLLASPSLLILDNPFIGLDAVAREQLKSVLRLLVESRRMVLYLVLTRLGDVPDFVDEIRWVTPREKMCTVAMGLPEERRVALAGLSDGAGACGGDEPVVELRRVSIKYGSRTILHDLDWTVRRGERWALSGQNGSGKSTLLSLITADNPQGYACDIRLFGRERGSGESIWEIKRRIGYVSPEMHRSYQRNLPALQVVASGLKDTIGLYVRPNEAEKKQCLWWMRLFGIEGMAERSFLSISSGEQRLVLLARAFVKDPELIILDEPMHGLDEPNKQMVKDIIKAFCQRRGKTLIMVSHYEEEWPDCINRRLNLVRPDVQQS